MNGQLRLDASAVTWLARLPGNVHELDVDAAYSFEHPLNERRELVKQVVEADQTNFLWWVRFYANDGGEVLDPPLARRVYAARLLYANPAPGPIAYNAAFYIVAKYQRRRLAREVYPREEEMYRRWGVREIHMQAQQDGLVVWIKKFGFLPVLAGTLADLYASWAPRHGQPSEIPSNPADYPDAFLREQSMLDLYKVLA